MWMAALFYIKVLASLLHFIFFLPSNWAAFLLIPTMATQWDPRSVLLLLRLTLSIFCISSLGCLGSRYLSWGQTLGIVQEMHYHCGYSLSALSLSPPSLTLTFKEFQGPVFLLSRCQYQQTCHHHEDDMQLSMWKSAKVHRYKGNTWEVIEGTGQQSLAFKHSTFKRSQVNQIPNIQKEPSKPGSHSCLTFFSGSMTLDKLLDLFKLQFLNYKIRPVVPTWNVIVGTVFST